LPQIEHYNQDLGKETFSEFQRLDKEIRKSLARSSNNGPVRGILPEYLIGVIVFLLSLPSTTPESKDG